MTDLSEIDKTTQEIVDEFAFFDDWMQRYEYIIEMGKALDGLPDDRKDDAHKVPGCQSQVWFHARRAKGRIHFDADSDAMIVRGLVAVLRMLYNGLPLNEVAAVDAHAELARLGLNEHLSAQRSNGVRSMVDKIQTIAA